MGLNFYKYRVCFHVLANRVQNAREIDEYTDVKQRWMLTKKWVDACA